MSMRHQGRPTRPATPRRRAGAAPHRRPRPAAGRAADLRAGRLGQDRRRPARRAEHDAIDLGGLRRDRAHRPAGLSEPETLRHYVRLVQKNHAIDLALYPLGSCTMKHNPRLNEKMARLPGFADLHPLQPRPPCRARWS